ncbi:MAG: UDP-N-acetylglucosamine--N-acetylmuramyl-(pentapeptide) pyrophosphoryl-undecaprenol N-acetylglucosamine transferase, partial [Elusimicrobia bacterium]|nr:UDP-N-acetylglucosamine--N-acetylmuramyl-(pentapeptide) pyrophosphoryl-undecaprenol N-acetylglucosamine transferase [Elusimicrobiota bacterium]
CFGSYLNAAGVICAKMSGAELYFFEPNAVPGKGTSLLKIFADKIFEVFPAAGKHRKKKTVLCKFPLVARKYGREEACAKLGFDSEKTLILILGGSQGSAFINDLMLRLLSKLCFAQIIHITGSDDFERVNALYNAHKGKHLVLPVSLNMPLLYSAADIAVSRAGAGTLAELSFYKIPSLLIPYPLAGAHQEKNAEFFSDCAAALMIKQRDAKDDNIFEAVENMISGNFWKFSENLAKISVSDDGSDLAEKISGE